MSTPNDLSSMEAPCSSGNAADQFLVADWVPVHAMDQNMKYGASASLSSYNVGSSNNSTIERLPSLSCFASDNLSEIMNSFGLQQSAQMAISMCPQDCPSTDEHSAEKNLKGKKRKKVPECGALQSNSTQLSNQNIEAEQQKDVTSEIMKNPMEKDEKQQKNEGSSGAKDHSDANKEDYIHVRAKRGQATNSHSLAERVRREKISERMRLLQDLVPGCNKITGKAVMLDEIINYVQSLQRQVEFLSMKLAAVNPEMNLDIEQIFTKENLHSRYGVTSAALGYSSDMVISHPQLPAGMTIASFPRDLLRPSTNLQISPMAQMPNPWDNEIQNYLQMGFVPNLPHDGTEMNGSMKVEL